MTTQRPRATWSGEGACLDDPLPYYDQPITKAMRAACASCPVLKECENYAILHERYGYWANMTEGQRTKVRKNQNPQYQNLVVQALREDWLEPNHLVRKEDLEAAEKIVNPPAPKWEPRPTSEKDRQVLESMSLSDFEDLPDFSSAPESDFEEFPDFSL